MTAKSMAGQTSRAVVGAEIQTSCNFQANLFDHYHLSGCYHYSTVVSTVSFFCNSPVISWYDILSPCLVISTFSSTKISFTIRHHHHQAQDHVEKPNQTNPLNVGRYSQAVSIALWLQLKLVVCYLPFIISLNLLFHVGPSSSVSIAFSYTVTLC